MLKEKYDAICDKIINATMANIDTSNMIRYTITDPIDSDHNAIYKSAVKTSSPASLIFTPAGTGKSELINDRIKAINEDPSKIMVLCMNIAKAKQMTGQNPGINAMTFSDFTHDIVKANYPDLELSDDTTIVNLLRLHYDDSLTKEFISKLIEPNPQDKATLLSLFVNNNIDDVVHRLLAIKKTSYLLSSLICQNKIYEFRNLPFDTNAIIVNGVHNMPVPILCCTLKYAFIKNSNIFITGSPKETIYEFNMAYSGSMDTLSSYTDRFNIIRLDETHKMDKNICDVLNEKMNAKASNIATKIINQNNSEADNESISKIIDKEYISTIISAGEKLLVVIQSKKDISAVKNEISKIENAKISDITTPPKPPMIYGRAAVKVTKMNNASSLPVGKLCYDLYNVLNSLGNDYESNFIRKTAENAKTNINDFLTKAGLTDMQSQMTPVDFATKIIEAEEAIQKEYMESLYDKAQIDENANVIISTIHAATDIRYDNVFVIIRNKYEDISKNLLRVALSRANKTEYIGIINQGTFNSPYQTYLKNHTILK